MRRKPNRLNIATTRRIHQNLFMLHPTGFKESTYRLSFQPSARAALDEIMRAKIREAIDDPRPSVPAAQVFANLRALHAKQVKADKRGA